MRTPIRSEDPDAVAQLTAKIAAAEKLQAAMKAANKIVRDATLTDDQKVARLTAECQIREASARALLKPDFAGRVGFAPFELTNNAANIRRMQDRVKVLDREGARGSVSVEFPGGKMEDNAEDCRVRVYHDQKPGREVIDKLKANGFHWTPTLGCWQRLRGDSARWAAARVTGVNWPEPAATATPVGSGPSVQTTPVEPNAGFGLSA